MRPDNPPGNPTGNPAGARLDRKSRRGFLKQAAAMLGAAAVFSGAPNRSAQTAQAAPAPAPPAERGYRLTAHIRRYYQRASF